MDREDFEYSLTQYLDGTLSAQERAAIEERLASDPAAQRLLAEYRKLDQLMSRAGAGMPALRWDLIAEQISQGVDEAAARPVYSIGRSPMRAALVRTGMALAASMLIVVGVMRIMPRQGTVAKVTHGPTEVAVAGPQAEAAAGETVIDVSVSAPQEADTAQSYIDNDSLLVRRPVIALEGFSDAGPEQFH